MRRVALEQRVKTALFTSVLGVSAFFSGCVVGPDGTTALQRFATQRVPSSPEPHVQEYATAKPMPESVPRQYPHSQSENFGAGILKAASWLFGIHGDIVPAAAFDIAADVQGRNAIISGQKEAAEIIRDGLGGPRQEYDGAKLPEGVERLRLEEFGTVEFIIAPRYTDYNGNGQPERNELHPSKQLSTKSGFWVFSEHFGKFTVYKPRIKLFDENGRMLGEEVVTDTRTSAWFLGNPHNVLPRGKYIIAFFGQVPTPGAWEQRPVGKQGAIYFLHAMPFEVVEE
jgi:hypothetical protein